jgi:hypothetical protein
MVLFLKTHKHKKTNNYKNNCILYIYTKQKNVKNYEKFEENI